jgi:hypothetical protein
LWIIEILFLLGAAQRLYQRKLDGLYITAYGAMILLWPFPNEIERFIIVVLPILMFQAVNLMTFLSRYIFAHKRFFRFDMLFLGIIALLALPALGVIATILSQPLSAELLPYRPLALWYGWYDRYEISENKFNMLHIKSVVKGIRALSNYVPESECIYNVKAVPVAYYSRRIAKAPPPENVKQAAFLNEIQRGGCGYFFFMHMMTPSISPRPLYPQDRLGDIVQPIVNIAFREENLFIPIGTLAVMAPTNSEQEKD